MLNEWQTVDPDQMLQNLVSDLDLHCLLMPACANIQAYYSKRLITLTISEEIIHITR